MLQASTRYLLTDSRQITSPKESVFFAIKGPNHDGHRFIKDLVQRGVAEFVVEQGFDYSPWQHQAVFHAVPHVVRVLQHIAQQHREQFLLPIIGITGSNGKTIVKEWLSQLLATDYEIVKSPKSYNSQIGVPLSVWQINKNHTLGIFEAGISQPNEMAFSERVMQPTLGIFTNLGSAHDEGFDSREQKLYEKFSLFTHVKALVYEASNQAVRAYMQVHNPSCELIAWQNNTRFNLPFTDPASVQNLNHCIATLQYLGFDDEQIQEKLLGLKPLAMRLELKEGINGCYLIDDTYNNDLAGLRIALDFLQTQNQRPHKVLILSDMLQAGLPEAELYGQIATLIQAKGVNQVIGIGPVISRYQHLFRIPTKFYERVEDFLAKLRNSDFLQSVVLIKGARKYAFERIVGRLVQKNHGTVLEINLDALYQNLNFFRQKLEPQTKIMAMVKAFAYGSGSAEVANLLQHHRVDYLAVAYTDEGVHLRQNGIKLPIMVMNPSLGDFELMARYNLEPEIYSFRLLYALPPTLPFHLKLDTGMHRLGFQHNELPQLLTVLAQNPAYRIASMFSHLAASDESHWDGFTQQQVDIFTTMANTIEAQLGYAPLRHLANSAGIARFPQARLDMVRLGIGLYGVAARPQDQAALHTVGTLKTVISQIKTIAPGESIGYGRHGQAHTETQIATIAIGYADGYGRGLGQGRGKVLINNVLCPTIGNVCMDMTMIDITGVQAQEGDEVIVLGQNPHIIQVADWLGTIPYEILTGISERVKRVYYQL